MQAQVTLELCNTVCGQLSFLAKISELRSYVLQPKIRRPHQIRDPIQQKSCRERDHNSSRKKLAHRDSVRTQSNGLSSLSQQRPDPSVLLA